MASTLPLVVLAGRGLGGEGGRPMGPSQKRPPGGPVSRFTMIRPGPAYFTCAVSAPALIGFAVTGFVVLMLLSGLNAFPLAGFTPGGGGAVSSAQESSAAAGRAAALASATLGTVARPAAPGGGPGAAPVGGNSGGPGEAP